LKDGANSVGKIERKSKSNLTLLGLDMSKRNSGVALYESGTIITSVINIPVKYKDNLIITNMISRSLFELIDDPANTYCMIEDYAFGAKGRTFELAEINGVLKWRLHFEMGIPREQIMICGGGQLKKFATGKGNCPKDIVIKEVFKRWGFDTDNNNEADAYVLVKILESLFIGGGTLTKGQEEVLGKIRLANA